MINPIKFRFGPAKATEPLTAQGVNASGLSIRSRILIGLVIFSILPLLIYGYLQGKNNLHDREVDFARMELEHARNILRSVEIHFDSEIQHLEDAARLRIFPALIRRNSVNLSEELKTLASARDIECAFFIDLSGKVTHSSCPAQASIDVSSESWFSAALGGARSYGHVQQDKASGRNVIPLAVPVFQEAGKENPVGILAVLYRWNAIDNILSGFQVQGHPQTASDHFMLTERNGLVIWCFDPGEILTHHLVELGMTSALEAQKGREGYAYEMTEHGIPSFSVYTHSEPEKGKPEWLLVVLHDPEGIFAEVKKRNRNFYFLLGALGAVLLLFAVRLSSNIAGPINEVTRAINRFKDDNPETRIALDAPGEAGVLANAFNEMAESLSKSRAELEQHRDHLEELVFARTAELAAAKDAAEAASRAKSIFLSTMSHELRTPMNGVMGMIDLVLRRATDPQQIDWLNKSKTSAKHLLDVINEILDISKIEADRLTLEEKNFSLSQVFDETFQMQGEAARAKGLHLSHEISPALPDLLCGDAMRLKQILINFTGNAIKFSETGQITVRAHVVEEKSHSLLLRIEVTDQGIGISAEQQSRLFQAFTQADGSMNRKFGGTGLGLAISKRIALLMGGDAGVISQEGQGSTFWFTAELKMKQEQRATARLEQTADVDAEVEIRQHYAGHRILVADDEPMNLEITLIQLEGVDLDVDTAEDGAAAIAMARKNRYVAILMDMQMPIINGLEATQQIREIPGYRRTPIIAMTANAFAEDKERCFAAGMNDFLVKPFNPDQLFAILLRALNQRDI